MYIAVCVALLLCGQFMAGHVMIIAATGVFALEDERSAAIAGGFQELLALRENLHARYATDFAHRDRTARAFAASPPTTAVNEYFAARAQDLARFDLVLAVNAENRLLYGESALRDRQLEKEFLEITALKLRDLQAERPPGDDAAPLRATTGPLYWHYMVAHGEHIYLLTLAAVCDDRGYPVAKGFVLFGERLEGLLENARRHMNLKSASIATTPVPGAYASVQLEAYGEGENFFVLLEPRHTIAGLARRILHALLILEALLALLLLGYGLPYIYHEPIADTAKPAPAAGKSRAKSPPRTTAKSATAPSAKGASKTSEKYSEKAPARSPSKAAAGKSAPDRPALAPGDADAGAQRSESQRAPEPESASNTETQTQKPPAAQSEPGAETKAGSRPQSEPQSARPGGASGSTTGAAPDDQTGEAPVQDPGGDAEPGATENSSNAPREESGETPA